MNDPGAGAAQPGQGGDSGVDRRVILQVALILLSWLYLCALHWSNDGLWFQGDSPRHMANGLFWKDYLHGLNLDPVGFAIAYYARYPAINPVSYPPVFYLLEAAAFSILGPSSFVAKGLVLAFTLIAALYTSAWLRRWVTPEAGCLGALVPLFPGVTTFSHAVMLNVPALALFVAALYHARRWLEAPLSRQIYPAAVLSVLAILCYIPSAVLVFVLIAWILALGRWRLLVERRTLVLATLAGLTLLPWALVVIRWAPGHVEMTTPTARTIVELKSWGYYLDGWPSIFGRVPSTLAAVGALAGIAQRRWRRETALLLIWIGVTYLVLTYLKAKDPRYILPLAAPMACLDAIAVLTLTRAVETRVPRASEWSLALAAMSALVAAQAWQAWSTPIPDIRGFRELVAFFDRVAPAEPIFYDGHFDGTFIVLSRVADQDFRRQIVRGDQLLYIAPMNLSMRPRDFVTSRHEVIEVLRRRAGCRWLAIEGGGPLVPNGAARLLRETVTGPEFERVVSFPISGAGIGCVQVYRMRIPVEQPEAVELAMPMFGADARLKARAIPREWINRAPGRLR